MEAVVAANFLREKGFDVVVRDDNGENPLPSPNLLSAGNLYSTENDLKMVTESIKKLSRKRFFEKTLKYLFLGLIVVVYIGSIIKYSNFQSYINETLLKILNKLGFGIGSWVLLILYLLFELLYGILRKKYPKITTFISPTSLRLLVIIVTIIIGILLNIVSTSDMNYWNNYLR